MSVLSLSQLQDIQSDALADDLEIDYDRMRHWSESEARAFFESGGRCAPPDGRLTTTDALLVEAGMQHLSALLCDHSLSSFMQRMGPSGSADGRRALLHRLKRCGVLALSERQAIVNALTRTWREGRIQQSIVAAVPLDPPVVLWRSCVQTFGELRMLSSKELALRLGNEALAQEVAAQLSHIAPEGATIDEAHVVLQLRPASLIGDALEALGWSFNATSLLLEGSGIAAQEVHDGELRQLRARLGQPVAFWTNHMCERGTEVAVFDYADCGERNLGISSWVLYPGGGYEGCVNKFRSRFGERVVGLHWDEVGAFLTKHRIQLLYILKEGTEYVPDVRMLPSHVRALVHCVFHANHPHGDIYAKISPCVHGQAPVVPHIVRPRDQHGPNMRGELGIPASATVFGRHGGCDTFSIGFAQAAVIEVAQARSDIYFLFLNTIRLIDLPLPNIIYLDRTSDMADIARFIRTCDAMLHARSGGETFGLAVAEFSAFNRPVLTSAIHDDDGKGSMHLDVLRAKGLGSFFYRDQASLVRLLLGFDRNRSGDFNAYRDFEPARVMATFEKVFLGAPPALAAPIRNESRQGNDNNSMPMVQDSICGEEGELMILPACDEGRIHMVKVGTIQLPHKSSVFLSSCRFPGRTLPPQQRGNATPPSLQPSVQRGLSYPLLHVFREDALATFGQSRICIARSDSVATASTAIGESVKILVHGEDPRMFMYQDSVYAVDNTFHQCRLIKLDVDGKQSSIWKIALEGKNFTFLVDGCELLLVHWFSPLRIYRVTLSADASDSFASLELIFRADVGLPNAAEFRGGTPGRSVGSHAWWGLLHRTHHIGGTLRHDAWAWSIRRSPTGHRASFTCSFSEVRVEARSPESNIFDPCSIFEMDNMTDHVGLDALNRFQTGLMVSTAESRAGWFEEQPFVTGLYEIRVQI